MISGRNIQLENGNWSRIHNDIWTALARTPLSGAEFRCLMFLFRKTYGSQKKADAISLSQWAEGTAMKRQNVWRELRRLIDRRVIYMIPNGAKRPATWGFNKYIEEWVVTTTVADPERASVIEDDYRSVIKDDDRSVIREDDRAKNLSSSSITICNQGGLQSVINSHESTKERKEVAAAAAAAAAAFVPDPFVAEYERIWGRLVESPYIGEQIASWQQRVTIDGWRYALQESTRANARNWRYLTSILNRIERDGFPEPAKAASASAIDYSLEELYGNG